MAKISIKYVLPTCIWKYFWQISRYFAFLGEFRGISRKYLNFAGPRPREISEALHIIYLRNTSKRNISKCFSQKRYEKVKYLSNSIFDKPVINLNNCNKLRNYQWKRNSIQPQYFKRSAYLSSLPRIHVEMFLCILSNLSRLMKCL